MVGKPTVRLGLLDLLAMDAMSGESPSDGGEQASQPYEDELHHIEAVTVVDEMMRRRWGDA